MSSSPKTIAVVCHFNKRDMLDQMLTSLRASGPCPFDVVVVDNASSDGSVEMLREKYPWVEVVRNPTNLGGTGGFNRGLKYALKHPKGYEFVWLLDNDVHVHPGAFEALMEPMLADPKVAQVGSAILVLEKPEMVQEIGARLGWPEANIVKVCEGPLAEVKRPALLSVDYVSACSCLNRVSAIREVGIWDPGYFLKFDDIEWGVRFNRAGWKVLATTESMVRHESFVNRCARSPAALNYLAVRNGYYFYRRFCPRSKLVQNMFRQFRVSLSIAANYEAEGRMADANSLRFAVRDFLNGTMGPPPADLTSAGPKGASAAPAPVAGITPRRVAMLANDNPVLVRKMCDRIRELFAGATVDTLVIGENPEVLRDTALPNRRIVRVDSLFARMRLMFTLPFQYDALAAPSYTHPYFFESFVGSSIRVGEDMTVQSRPRDLGRTARIAMLRAFIIAQAAWLTVRALMLRQPKIDYRDFRE